MRTQVAILGAGPAGLLLSHLLAADGIESVVVETRSEEYVLSRIRAGVLEQSSVDLLASVGLGERLRREGMEHRGIYLQWPGERHHLDFVDLVGRSVWIYGQTELQKDLVAARRTAEQPVEYEISDAALHDIDTDRPYLTFVDKDGRPQRLDADVIVGCDGSHGPSRNSIPALQTWERTYPFAWLGVLAAVAPSTDELIYAWHPDGFALHSMRSHTVSRLYLQVAPDEDLAAWSDQRIWDALAARLGHGQDGWRLTPGEILEKSVLPMRSHVATPMRHHRLFLAGDAGHIVQRPRRDWRRTTPACHWGSEGRPCQGPVSVVVAVDGLGDAHRLGCRIAFDHRIDDGLHAAGDVAHLAQRRAEPDRRADRHGRGEPHLVQSVVHRHADAVELEQLRPERDEQRQCEEAVRDGTAERAVLRPLDVDVDPLMVVSRVGEGVDALLRHLEPAAVAQVLAEPGAKFLKAVDDDGH
jgi:p-hydroxybenzoate 3-monooxygenase